jgi:hypothetical protein
MPDQSDEALVFAALLATAQPEVLSAILALLEGVCDLPSSQSSAP